MVKNKMVSKSNKNVNKKNNKKKSNDSDSSSDENIPKRLRTSSREQVSDKPNDLSVDDKFRLADLYFDKENIAYRVLYDSFNKFLDEDIKIFLEHGEHAFSESKDRKTAYKNRFKFNNIRIQEPKHPNGDLMFPKHARRGNYTYSVKLIADVTQYQDVEDIATGEKKTHQIGNPEENVPVANIPVMLRSRWCNLSLYKNADNNGEGKFDVGGYFIVNGNEKVVICQDRMIDNKPLVFVKKDSGSMVLGVNINSRSYGPRGEIQVMFIKMKKDGILVCRVPIFNEVNIIAIMKALGLETDKDIVDRIVGDDTDIEMINLVRTSLDNCRNEKNIKIKTSQQAIDYLITKMKSLINYDEVDKDVKLNQKKKHLQELLKNALLPHIDSGILDKAYYIGYMINKLLSVQLGRAQVDDRDSYTNKRIDTQGDLFFEIFKLQMKKVMGECKKYFNDRTKQSSNIPNIIDHIKPGTIEQGLKASLSTGHWGRRQGVAQMLPRLTTTITRSMLARVDAPGGDAATSKLTGPRHLHFSSVGFLCCLTGDTEILQGDGSIKLIKDMKDRDIIKSVDRDTLEEIDTPIMNFFSKYSDKIFELETDDGKKLKCTNDHPILVNKNYNNVMINAEKLKKGDLVIIRSHNYDYVDGIGYNYSSLKSIKQLEGETVYDFTTCFDTHTIIANGFVTSNCASTPEHAKIGLTKHTSLIGSVTIMSREQYYMLKDYVNKKATPISNISLIQFKNGVYYKMFFNGQWVGGTKQYLEMEKEFQEMKLKGIFDRKNVSIIVDHQVFEVRIYCDSGRLVRPVLRVEDNEIVLKKEHLNQISLNKSNRATKITTWEEFINKHPYVVEYICMEQQPYLMIAETSKKVEFMRKRMVDSISKVKNIKSNHTDNRYDEFSFSRYTHCEIHPSLLLGEIIASMQFCNHTPGTRNMFQYAQGKQAMGIPTDVYRHRYDLCFVAYNPQRRMVTTRASKYTMAEQLPAGENAIVAIATYTGYNQEDAIVINETAFQRGKYNAMYLKKIPISIQKNMSTGGDDIFMKPNADELVDKRTVNYEMLNDEGYAPEESPVDFGTVLFGKVTPINNPVGNKKYKDSSESYKQHVPGYVDRVEIKIQNPDGYELRKMSVRTERIPNCGDKFCCYDDQTEILTDDGWILFKDLTRDHKVASLVDDGKTLVYQHPTKIMKFDYDGKMYRVKSQHVDLMVTPNHRMWLKKRDHAEFEIIKAEDTFNKAVKYQKNVENYDPLESFGPTSRIKKNKFIIPEDEDMELDELKLDLDAFVEFFGIWLAEGCLLRDYAVSFAAHKQRVKDRLVVLSEIMGLEFRRHKTDDGERNAWIFPNKVLTNYFHKNFRVSNAQYKHIPLWAYKLDKERAKILIYGMMLGDGHVVKHNNTTIKNTVTDVYDTSSVNLKDNFQRLCLHAGLSCNYVIKNKKGETATIKNGDREGEEITTTTDHYRLTVNKSQNTPEINRKNGKKDSWVKYKGKIYSCAVPNVHPNKNKKGKISDGGIVYVRRNNKPVWCGQSQHGNKGTIGLQLNAGDMPFTSDGMTPDIIINPHAFPGRMTAGQLIEGIYAKAGAITGRCADGTQFEETDIEPIKKILKDNGFNESGKEYLYNGFDGFMMPVSISFGPTYYQRLRHLVEDKMHCHHATTEVLTYKGWKLIEDVTLKDKVATLDNGELVYEYPTKILHYPDFKGKMYKIKSQQVDLYVTDNHRMWVAKSKGAGKFHDYDFAEAKDIYGRHVKYKKDAEWNAEDYQFVLPTIENGKNRKEKLNMNAWLTFFGIWIAEGWTKKSNLVETCQIKKRVENVMANALEKLGYNYKISKFDAQNSKCSDTNTISINDKQLYTYMKQFTGAHNKYLPSWVWKLSTRQARILLESMILGDGSYSKNKVTTRYYTCSPQLADDVMRLALHCGWSANKYTHLKAGNTTEIRGEEVISNYDVLRLGIVKTKNNPSVNHSHTSEQSIQKESIEKYEGPVYCLKVPSEVFYVRRNGKAVWSGNSRARGPVSMLTRQAPEGRARDGGLRVGEMERDALIAHGIALFAKEKLLDNSDAYKTYVCGECGLFAQRFVTDDQTSNSYYCPQCNNHNDIHKVIIPYAFKLLLQECISMCIAPRLRFKKTI